MSRKAYYFSHDSNAKDDPKCMLLIDQLGLEGYGIYWVLVEVLREQNDYKYPLKLVPILARRYSTTAEKMLTVIKNYGLFEVVEDVFFSLSLIERMEKMNNTIEQKRLAGIASAEKKRLLKEAAKTATDVQQPFNGCSTGVQHNLNKEKKGKEIKEDIIYLDIIDSNIDIKEDNNIITTNKEIEIEKETNKEKEQEQESYSFEEFWRDYDKKVGEKEKIKKKFNNLKKGERERIRDYIPKYKESTPDKQYRKNPETFLNNKSWNDEIITTAIKESKENSAAYKQRNKWGE